MSQDEVGSAELSEVRRAPLMKVEDNVNISSALATQSGKTSEAAATKKVADSRAEEFQRVSGGDEVDLSQLAGRLLQSMNVAAAERVDRIQKLGVELQAGRYAADARAVSRAIVTETLHASSTDPPRGPE